MGELVGISLDEFNSMKEKYLAGEKIFDSDTTYVLDLENCNGITSQMLESLEKFPVDVKFKIQGDLYNNNNNTAFLEYNYNIEEMEKIISVIEEIGKDMPKNLNDFGRYIYIYRILCECIEYQEIHPADSEQLFETKGMQRSLYSTLLNGDGVCVGYALALKNVLNYYDVECIRLSGYAYVSEDIQGKHAWNAVQIDGKWYFADLTWDSENPENLRHCLKVNEEFLNSHGIDDNYKEKLSNCNFAEKDFEDINVFNAYIYKEFNLENVIERIKSHKIEKKKFKTIYELTGAELARDVFGDERYEEFLKHINEVKENINNQEKELKDKGNTKES